MNSIVISSCLTLVVTAPEVRCHVPQQEQFAEDGQSARVSMLYGRWHSHAGPNKGNPSRVIAILSLSPDGKAFVSLGPMGVTGDYRISQVDGDESEYSIEVAKESTYYVTRVSDNELRLKENSSDEIALYRRTKWTRSDVAGIWQELHSDLELVLQRGRFRNKMKSGVWEEFHASMGRTKLDVSHYRTRIETFDNGIMDGSFIEWHGNGQLFQMGQYNQGAKSGHWPMWDMEGHPIGESIYQNGKVVDGDYIEWHIEGSRPSIKGQMTSGERSGHWVEYDRDGSVISETQYP